ncbi:MAG: DUF2905 domain-containing protein [Bdellovibrionia bacterium]
MMLHPVSKTLMIGGLFLIVLGLIFQLTVQWGGKAFQLGHLPGDLHIQKENVQIFIPITTCLLLSLLGSALLYLIQYFVKKN